MNEGEEAASMDTDLPQEILVSILVRLPINSILRCRSVCKSWRSLIADPLFISAHLNHQSTAGAPTVLIRQSRADYGHVIRYTLNADDDSLTHIAEFGSPFANAYACPRILGVVNGLICLLDDTKTLMLWNPAIRKSITLPSPVAELSSSKPPCFGFGSALSPTDFKVVRIAYGGTGPRVRVYRLSTGSWCDIELNMEASDLPLLFPRQAYLNGVVHWIGHNSTILGFNFQTEKFRILQLPGELEARRMQDVGIAAWCGNLALFELVNPKNISLWVMKVYDNVQSWTKQCVICAPYPFSTFRVKCIRCNGRILVEGFDLYWFDPWTKETSSLNIEDIGDSSSFHVKSYTQSLSLLGRVAEPISCSTRKKRKRWSQEEEKLLANAWLNARKDVEVVDRVWKWRQIEAYFGGQRDLSQLKQHWYVINNSVSKFHGWYKKLCDELQNGVLDENGDVLLKSYEAYRGEEGVEFRHEHVWRVLKDEPRWNGSESSKRRVKVAESEKRVSSARGKGKEKIED